jgi:hypothetical protein
MQSLRMFTIILMLPLIFGSHRAVATQTAEAKNWCAQAEASLTDKFGNPISCKDVASK